MEKMILFSLFKDEKVRYYLNLLKAYDEETFLHSVKVAFLSEKILSFIQNNNDINEEEMIKGALLHDIGKLKVDKAILCKQENLSKEEMNQIKMHPLHGLFIVAEENFSTIVKDIILKHHERLDGKGYVCGYDSENIGQEVRIVAIADIYSALTEKRCYKQAFGQNKSLHIMEQESKDGWIDAYLLDILKSYLETDNHFSDDVIQMIREVCRILQVSVLKMLAQHW